MLYVNFGKNLQIGNFTSAFIKMAISDGWLVPPVHPRLLDRQLKSK
jgi:hypothetical protein